METNCVACHKKVGGCATMFSGYFTKSSGCGGIGMSQNSVGFQRFNGHVTKFCGCATGLMGMLHSLVGFHWFNGHASMFSGCATVVMVL